jgi:hypothetical protein
MPKKNPFYVYALKDVRVKPAKPFYIGKGTGNRAWEHQMVVDDSEKGRIIQEIKNAGFQVIHTIMADDLTETQALKIEAELISAFGIRSRGGLLTNRVQPNTENIAERIRINIPAGCYEKAQMGLNIIKAAIKELADANPQGLRNCDVAKYLGLQSDNEGNSKDYLSYSILGLLLKDGKIKKRSPRIYNSIR